MAKSDEQSVMSQVRPPKLAHEKADSGSQPSKVEPEDGHALTTPSRAGLLQGLPPTTQRKGADDRRVVVNWGKVSLYTRKVLSGAAAVADALPDPAKVAVQGIANAGITVIDLLAVVEHFSLLGPNANDSYQGMDSNRDDAEALSRTIAMRIQSIQRFLQDWPSRPGMPDDLTQLIDGCKE